MKLYRSNRTEQLVEALAEVLRIPSGDPFEPELVAVHGPGVAKWLSLELSRRLGVCAGLRFTDPAQLLEQVIAAALPERARDLERWSPGRLRWVLLDLLPGLLEREDFSPLRVYLRDDPALRGEKASQLAAQIGETFARYLLYRQGLLRRWEEGEGEGWQPELFRALSARIDAPHLATLAPELLRVCGQPELCRSLLPARVCLFGISTLPPIFVQVLSALGRHLDVHLFLNSPTPRDWADLRTLTSAVRERQALSGELPPLEEIRYEIGHALLASLGRLGRDLQALLEDLAVYEEVGPSLYVDPTGGCRGATMLRQLQADMLHLENRGSPGSSEPLPISTRDRSITVHACHGPMRQVEVLQDQLLSLFDDNHDLEPRDVVVMTPDIETFAPLIAAVFDHPRSDPRHIPFRIADRPIRQLSPVAEALLRILELPRSRLSAPVVLDLLGMEPIHTRFGMTGEDLEQVIEWVRAAGVRWGIDAAHRELHGQPPYHENTWRFGLDRLLLGYSFAGGGRWMFGGVLPYDEVEGGGAVLLGQLAEFCDRLFRVLGQLEAGPRSVGAWRGVLASILSDLISTSRKSSWEHEQLLLVLDELARDAEGAGFEGEVELPAIRAALGERLDRADEAAGFASGQLTFCGMVPLRHVPFRVVALLGLDDGAFPRPSETAGFDLTLHQATLGDRAERDDDRQLFLEALLAARDRLLITFSGHSVRDNRLLPPAGVVSELLDVLSAGFVAGPVGLVEQDPEARRRALLDHVLVHHPLHPFSPRNFGASGDERLFTYASSFFDGARSLAAQHRGAPPFIAEPIGLDGAGEADVLSLDELLRFFEQPVQALLELRLGVRFTEAGLALPDREPLELDPLERYQIAWPLLDRRLDGEDLRLALGTVRAAGVLPFGTPGRLAYDAVLADVEPVVEAVLACQGDAERLPPVSVDQPLADGGRLIGRVDGLFTGNRLIKHRYARLKARDLLKLWIRHLVLECQLGVGSTRSILIARSPAGGRAALTCSFRSAEAPGPLLEQLVRLYRVGLERPLLFFPETSRAYAEAFLSGGAPLDPETRGRALAAAAKAWSGGTSPGAPPGEGALAALVRVFGPAQPFRPGFRPPEGDLPGELDFHALALTIFGPLRDHIQGGA